MDRNVYKKEKKEAKKKKMKKKQKTYREDRGKNKIRIKGCKCNFFAVKCKTVQHT